MFAVTIDSNGAQAWLATIERLSTLLKRVKTCAADVFS